MDGTEQDDGPGTLPVDDMEVVHRYADPAEAHRAAAGLVEQGLGAELRAVGDTHEVRVMRRDLGRARRLLGITAEPGHGESDEDLRRITRPWLIPVLVFAAVMIIVPLAAFLISYKISGG